MEPNNTKTALIAAFVALLAIGGGTAYLLTRDDSESTTTQTQSQTENQSPAASEQAQQNIVEIAAAGADFTTLVTAVQAASLAETLSDETKEFTVFAPTNAAFAKLPAGTVDNLVKPENKSTLTGILTYHVVSGKVTSDKLSNGQKVKTLAGGELTVEIANGSVYLIDAKGGKAMVTSADVDATNGVIHVIDNVLMP